MAPQRLSLTRPHFFRVLLGTLMLAGLGGCPNQEYSECDDLGCYYCDGLGCRDAAPPGRVTCDCAHPCASTQTCTELGCTDECSVESDCPSGSTCVEGLCLGFVSRGVRESATAIDCSCESNDDCSDGLICRDMACVPGCETNDDCQAENPGYACVDGSCVPTVTPECDATRPCAEPNECVDGECRAPAATCQFSSECGPGRVCVDQECTTACGLDNPCPTGAACEDGYCVAQPPPIDVCVVNADCEAGEVCRNGACWDACSTDAECGEGRYCLEGRCRLDTRPQPTCGPTRDCAAGSVCLNGTCRIPCDNAAECAEFDVQYNFCLDMLCATTNEATSNCSSAAECDAGERCIDGVCN